MPMLKRKPGNAAHSAIPRIPTRAMAPITPSSFDAEAGTVRVIATTEAPARVWDWDQYDLVDEILLMDGMVLPRSGQVPLLDSHNRHSVQDVLGSATNFAVDTVDGFKAAAGDVTYAGTPDGQAAAQKTREGHLTDYSIGYSWDDGDAYWVPDGQKSIINGNEYNGPVRVVTRWKLLELSTTPIGADEYAKARSAHPGRHTTTNTNGKEIYMDPKLKQLLIGRGLAADATDDAAWEFFRGIGLVDQRALMDQATGGTPQNHPGNDDAAIQRAIAEERTRCNGIRSRCRTACIDDDVADDMIQRGISLETAGEEIFQRMSERNPPVGVTGRGTFQLGPDERDKFRAAAGDAMLIRAGLTVEKPAAGHADFRGHTLMDIGRACLERAGVNTRGMSRSQLADGIISARAIGATSTSDFPYLLAAVTNKRLQKAYAEAPATWRPMVNVVPAADFKAMYGVSLSGSPSLQLIGENGEYKEAAFSENQESYYVKSYGLINYLSRKMLINDDLRGFQRIPQLFGAAARRKEADLVYALITGNPTMNDGNALFSTTHKNLATTAALVTLDSLSAGRAAMRKQTGLKSEILDVVPAFLLVPAAQETTGEVILRSAALPEADKSGGVYNPWKGKLTPIADPRLDANSVKAWYLVGDPSQVDTIEVAYLDGNEQPYIDEQPMFERDAIGTKCRHDFGCGIMDHVGFYKNAGE